MITKQGQIDGIKT